MGGRKKVRHKDLVRYIERRKVERNKESDDEGVRRKKEIGER